jgi:hypothetical protein
MSIAKYAALRAVRVHRALCAGLENGVVVFTFAFLSAQASSRGSFLKNKKASSD